MVVVGPSVRVRLHCVRSYNLSFPCDRVEKTANLKTITRRSAHADSRDDSMTR